MQHIVNADGLVAAIPDNFDMALQVRSGWLPASPEQIAAFEQKGAAVYVQATEPAPVFSPVPEEPAHEEPA